MKKVKQFRFFGTNHPNNSPNDNYEVMDMNNLYSGRIFEQYTPIVHLGIQSIPGTQFYLNDTKKRNNKIILGYSGIYEQDLEGFAEINALCFELESLKRINEIDDAYLIIDIVYDDGEVEV